MKKVVQKNKKVPIKKVVSSDPHTEEIKRYIGAVSEDFQHRVSAIAEQFLGLNEKIDKNSEILNEKIDKNAEILNEKIDKNSEILNEKLDVHTDMIGRLMIDMEEVKTGLQQKVGRDEFNRLESRLVSLEAIVFTERSRDARAPKSK